MKNILESPVTFEAYARIDCCYFILRELYEQMGVERSGIEIMIDEATGFAEHKINEARKSAIDLMSQIIADKYLIGEDYSKDQEVLDRLIETKPKTD